MLRALLTPLLNLAARYPLPVLLAGVFCFQSLLAGVPPLSGDEAFYWEWSRHPDLAYYSHPPMVAWLIGASTWLFGTHEFSVRLPAIVLQMATVALVWRMGYELGGKRFALWAGGLYALLPLSVVFGSMITTDRGLIFFWALAAWGVKQAVVDGRRGYWYGAGLALGGMLLSKFFAFLFFPSVGAWLLAHPRHRRQWITKEPYLAFGLALLVFAPFLYWNATHDWMTFQFNLVSRHQNEGLNLEKPLVYLAGQMLAASPAAFWMMAVAALGFGGGGVLRLWRGGGVSPQADALVLYGFLTGVPLLIWLVQSFGVTVGGHYAAVAYPTGAVVLAAWLHRLPDGFDWTSPTRKIALVLCVAGMAAINIPLAVMVIHPRVLPDKYMVMERGNPRQPIGANYYGWREAGRHIAQLNAAWNRGQGFFLSTSDYSIASMLGFYTPGRPEFLLLDYGPKEFHGREFLLWGQGKKTMGANTLYVADHPKMAGYIKPFFQDTRALPPLEIRDAKGRVLRIFYFTLGFGYKDNEPQVLWAW